MDKDLPKPQTDFPLPEKEIPASNQASSNILKSKFLWGFVAISVLFAFLLGGFMLGKNTSKKASSVSSSVIMRVSPIPTQNPAIAGWKTYNNQRYGFSVKYPSNLLAEENPGYSANSLFVGFTFGKDANGNEAFHTYDIFVVPTTFSSTDTVGYDFLTSEWINSLYVMSVGDVKPLANLLTFKRLADTKVSGQDGLVFEVDLPDQSQPKQQRVIVKKNGYFYILEKDYRSDQELTDFKNFLSSFKFIPLSTNKLTDSTSASTTKPTPAEAPLAGMKWYTANSNLSFQVPTDFVYNNSSTSDFISFLQKQNDIMAQRMNVQIIKTNDSLQAYLQKNNFDENGFDAPTSHEAMTVDGHSAIAIVKTFNPEQGCGISGTGTIKRNSALVIQGSGTIYAFVVNDACTTVGTDWFSKIFPTIRIAK